MKFFIGITIVDFDTGGANMIYELMHKNIKVLTMEIDEKDGWISKIYETHHPDHLPVGVSYKRDNVERAELNEWWTGRSIPASRAGIRDLIETLDIVKPTALLTKCYGLSLSDQYWAKPKDLNLQWADINYFDNSFSEDIGDILIGQNTKTTKDLNLNSPDNTSEGNLRKRWKIINNERILLKAGSGALQQEVFNEKIASKIMDRLNIPHVKYDVLWINETPYSACKDFINSDEDLVSAWRFMKLQKQNNSDSSYTHLCKLAKEFNVENFQEHLDKMLVLDFIIANEDRHFNNFGFIRDVNTLAFKGVAPIYDSGSSLGFETATARLAGFNPKWKPFMHGKVNSQLDLVSSFEWINFTELKNIEQDIREVFSESKGLISQDRTEAVIKMVNNRIQQLESYSSSKIDMSKKKPLSLKELTNKVYNFAKGDLSKEDLVNGIFSYEAKEYRILDIVKEQGKHQANAIIEDCETKDCFLEKNFAGANPFKMNLKTKASTTSLQQMKQSRITLE